MDITNPGDHTIPEPVRRAMEASFGLGVPSEAEPFTGEESRGWRVTTPEGDRFLQLYPRWRTLDEIAWCHEVAVSAAAGAPDAVTPLNSFDGATVVGTVDGPLSLFPYVVGSPLDEAADDLRTRAAWVLAGIHRGTSGAVGTIGRRPLPSPHSPAHLPAPPDTRPMLDTELDRWEAELEMRRVVSGPIHGDYYPKNVLVSSGRIVGVVDWLEARVWPFVRELGWATWEFCQNEAGDDLLSGRAADFLHGYLDAGGPTPSSEFEHLIPSIRWRLRHEVRRDRAGEVAGLPWDGEYRDAEMRAFAHLRGRSLVDL